MGMYGIHGWSFSEKVGGENGSLTGCSARLL